MPGRKILKKESSGKTRVGKAQAREHFPALVEAVSAGGGPIEITDYGKLSAVLVSPADYQIILAGSRKATRNGPCGTMILLGDLDEGAEEISQAFADSIEKTGRELLNGY